jgi:hypothetical protein
LRLAHILFWIVIAITGVDCAWLRIEHFDVDLSAYLTIGGVALILAAGGLFYEYIRKDTRLSGMLLGTSFLVAFSSAFAMLNYFLLTVAGPRIDNALAAVDSAMGVDWPVMMGFAAAHPLFNSVLLLAYRSVLPQVAILVICLGWRTRRDEIESFCLALAMGAFLTVGFWTMFPSFGAFSVHGLPADIENRLTLALDSHYAHQLVTLLADGPGQITPSELKGLIGFPSFHIVLAILVTWYARTWKAAFWPLATINLLVLVATPIQGGHHVIDVVGGVAVAALAIGFVRWIAGLVPQDADARYARYAQNPLGMSASMEASAVQSLQEISPPLGEG